MQRGNFSNFHHFRWPSWILAENKTLKISREMVRVRAILSEFLTRRIVREYPVPRRKLSIFTAFGGHLGF